MILTVLKYCGTILRVKIIEHSCSTEQKKQMWHKNAACLNIIFVAARRRTIYVLGRIGHIMSNNI